MVVIQSLEKRRDGVTIRVGAVIADRLCCIILAAHAWCGCMRT